MLFRSSVTEVLGQPILQHILQRQPVLRSAVLTDIAEMERKILKKFATLEDITQLTSFVMPHSEQEIITALQRLCATLHAVVSEIQQCVTTAETE